MITAIKALARRAPAGACVVLALGQTSACSTETPQAAAHQTSYPSGSSPAVAWKPYPLPAETGIRHCGVAYQVQERTNTISLGGCAGVLSSRIPRALKLKVGDVIYIRPTTEPDGSLAFPIPEAVGHALKRTAVRGAIAQYQAAHAGNAVLVARDTPFCEAHNPQEGTCRILKIEVRPRS